ncbi:MAG: long-chain fatty acid--CoA ligase [Pseudomonadota bacterium]
MELNQGLHDINTSTAQNSKFDQDYLWLKSYPETINWAMELQPKPVYEFLDISAQKIPNNTCTFFLGKTSSYKEIQDDVNRAAKGLQKIGVKKGTKVGLLLPNTPTFIIFYFAILKTGATVVNYNPLYTVEELSVQAKDSQTEIMITHDLKILFDKAEALLSSDLLSHVVVCPFAQHLPFVKSLLFRIFKGKELATPTRTKAADKIIHQDTLFDNDGAYEPVSIDLENDVALLQYTGGTTGTPKGAMLTHSNLSTNVEQIKAWAPDMRFGQERIMGVLPFFHVFAMTAVMNYGVAIGAELILIPKFELVEGLTIINNKKPTIMPGVPTLYNAMINYPKLAKYDLSSINFCISGGAALPVEVKRAFEEHTGCNLVEGYGLTETSPVASCNLEDGPTKAASIGIPIPRTVLSIRSLDDPEKEVPLGEKGEICISGPQVMKGYWQNEVETKDAFVGDFFRSGDIGYMDEDGYTYIVDRLKDLIICSGFNVYPRRIEEAIYAHPGVEEVTVIGIPDDYRGEAPKAFVKLKQGHSLTKEALLEFLVPKISKIEMPSEIEFRNELPKTMIGKLSKKELRQEG